MIKHLHKYIFRTIDKRRLREHTGHADRSVMEQVDSALAVSFGLQGS